MIITGLTNKQKEIANDILNSTEKIYTIKASRQSGKTFLMSYLGVIFGLTYNDNIMIVSPTYSQVKIIYNNILKIPNIHQIIKNKKEGAQITISFKTGSTLFFKSGDRPDSLRGSSNKIVLLDEFAFTKENLLEEVIRPTTNAKVGSKIIIASTPKGTENTFYKYYMNSVNGMTGFKHYDFSYNDNPFYDLLEVENAKLSLPLPIYLQEYEGQFIENNGEVFGDFRNVMNVIEFKIPTLQKCYAGIDFGRANDDTVLTILNNNKEVIFMKEYKGDWSLIIDNLSEDLIRYKPITYAESNGVGDPVISMLKKKYNNIIPFFQTNETNNSLVESLILNINQGTISLPSVNIAPKLSSQMNTFSYTLTKQGKISYHHKPGYHDDYIFSLLLSIRCHEEHNKTFKLITGQPSLFRQ